MGANDSKSTAAAAMYHSNNTPQHRIIQNFLLVWLDANIDESNDDFQKSMACLQHIVVSINTFTEIDECIVFLKAIKNEKVFMIVSGALGQRIVPKTNKMPHLDSIYVFCNDESYHKQWAQKWSKVKGVYTQIQPIYDALQQDRERCDRDSIPFSINGIDSSFKYIQLFKEVILEIDDNDDDTKSIQELVAYCRLQQDIPEDEIIKVEREYHCNTPIWWYTAPYFLCSMLNRALRTFDVDIILKISFFIPHLHRHLEQLNREQQLSSLTPFKTYRGQGLLIENFEKIKKARGSLMSFNNFLLTSRNRDVSLNNFARPAAQTDPQNQVGILFEIAINPSLCKSTTFALLNNVSYYEHAEEEILFSTHTFFCIKEIQSIDDHNSGLYQVNLILIGDSDNNLDRFTGGLRHNITGTTRWSRLGSVFLTTDEHSKAEQLYQLLAEGASNDNDRAYYTSLIGSVYEDRHQYSNALPFYEKALAIKEKNLPPNHPDLVTFYNNIGETYYSMRDTSKALSFYEKVLDIRQKTLPPNHPDLGTSYRYVGMMYADMGKYSEALSFYEIAREIFEKSLPSTDSRIKVLRGHIEHIKEKL